SDEIVTNSLSRSLSGGLHVGDTIENFVGKNDLTADDLSDFFAQISNLPLRVFQKYETRLKKRFDQLSKNAGEQIKRALYEGFSKLASVSLLTSTVNYPTDYAHLPENSVLRAVVAQFCEKSQCERELLHDLLSTLVGHIRSDGHRLPPLDLQSMLSLVDYRNDEQARLNLLSLAIEQKDPQILYELTCPQLLNGTSTSASYWTTVSKNLPALIRVLPVSRARAVVNGLLKFALQCADNGATNLRVHQRLVKDASTYAVTIHDVKKT
ncbi:hypothetical protein OSTOST_01887, partial [Ostertagia ostertagi]